MAADEGDKTGGDEASKAARRERDKRQKPPVTIDLTAASVASGPPRTEAGDGGAAKGETKAAEEKAPEAAAAKADRTSKASGPGGGLGGFAAMQRALAGDEMWRRSAMAGVVGGVAAFLLVIILQAIGLLPAPGRSTANQALEQSTATSDALAAVDRRVTAMEAMTEGLSGMRGDIRGLDTRLGAVEGGQKTLATRGDLAGVADKLTALTARVEDAPAPATAAELDTLRDRVDRLEAAIATGGGTSTEAVGALTDLRAELTALGKRVEAAENKAASTPAIASGDAAAAMRGMALESLRRSSESTGAFQVAVDGIAALGAPGDKVSELRAYAGGGTPGVAELAAEFPSVADAIVASTATGDPDTPWWQRIVGSFGSLVSVRPSGPVAGNGPPAVVSRMTAAVQKGDLATALAERRSLPPGGLEASQAWAEAAARRVALDKAVDEIARSFDGAGAG